MKSGGVRCWGLGAIAFLPVSDCTSHSLLIGTPLPLFSVGWIMCGVGASLHSSDFGWRPSELCAQYPIFGQFQPIEMVQRLRNGRRPVILFAHVAAADLSQVQRPIQCRSSRLPSPVSHQSYDMDAIRRPGGGDRLST
ncbi:uncharacterized protein BO88DRAFT_128286 [Aspergillus vadensis CBS 113365]|uniref:Uncharacterized protein n=1 Tax=Aspergillus vadensis (strain CBS 113365 / IMI 142717 / IBT 24658) TaxID=1448311 RepID=A0A319B1Y1_ASPVC|nr:hypothetical protein BO88DRAFT_128286 [Aspergillus vadensis CBS 113365]PYH65854.1 hypothetical protein BO88DRAFT_128286 [Aspergillus vadensis CBS 113365]